MFEVAKDGVGKLETTLNTMTLFEGDKSIVGKALVVHEQKEKGKPKTVACGVITTGGAAPAPETK